MTQPTRTRMSIRPVAKPVAKPAAWPVVKPAAWPVVKPVVKPIVRPAAGARRASVWSYLGMPLLWLGNIAIAGYAVTIEIDLELVPLLSLGFTALYLLLFERLLPYRRTWHPNAREWLSGAGYLAISMVASTALRAGLAAVAIALAAGQNDWPLWLDAPLALLLSTFLGYWLHRLMHEHRWLWKVHGVHHSPGKQSFWFANYAHFIEIAVAAAVFQGTVLLLGCSPEAVMVVAVFQSVLGYAVHANTDLRIGRFNQVIGSAEQHRLHHSTELAEAGNYGAFIPLWDQLFGTFTWRPGHAPERVGVAGEAVFPPSHLVLRNTLHPFR